MVRAFNVAAAGTLAAALSFLPLSVAMASESTSGKAVKADVGDELDAGSKTSATASTSASAPDLEEIVRGVYVEMRGGIGYTVLSQKIGTEAAYPQLQGVAEGLGTGAAIDMALGYEFTDFIAAQLLGGMSLLNGTRSDRVRGVSVVYGGLGLRLQIPLRERVHLIVAPGVTYSKSDNAVDPASTGLGIIASVGFEYYVHVRHFSLGVDLTAVVPTAPVRGYVGVMPHVKYTF